MLDDVTPHTAKLFSSDLDDSQKWPDRVVGGTVPPSPPRGAATACALFYNNSVAKYLWRIKNMQSIFEILLIIGKPWQHF